jgi:hypothetical protein
VNTVCGVAFRESIPVETLRERIGRIGLDVAALSLESIRELLGDPEARTKISAKDLAIIHGIATTNAQLLLGGATARIESPVITTPSHSAYLDFIRNVTPATGSEAATAATKEGPAAIPAGADAPGLVVELPAQEAPSPTPTTPTSITPDAPTQ